MRGDALHSWWVTISQTGAEGWQVAVSNAHPPQCSFVTYDVEDLEASVTETVTDAVVKVTDLIWQHELAAFAYQERSRPLAMARQLMRACISCDPKTTLAASHGSQTEAETVAFAVRAFLGRENSVRGLAAQVWRQKLKWAVAAALAWPALIVTSLRYGGSAPSQLLAADAVHAVHGEWETRTRHLLPPQYDPGLRSQYLIIGRPRRKLRAIEDMFLAKSGLRAATLIRPLDLRACFFALGPGLRKIAAGVDDASRSPIPSSWRESLAVAFRMMQGSAHRNWWRRRESTPPRVVFGHTGTADASQLEQEMQSGGTQTVHVAHGINHGWPFAGVSDIGLFQSKHDAGLAASLGAYRQTTYLPAACPKAEPDGDGWLILTSYTHPMGRPYAIYGVAPDVKALDLVAEAAKQAHVDPSRVVWRPHPAIAKVKAEDRDALDACASRHGFSRWPDGRPLETLKSFAVIITTPSTVLLDALHLGKCPILVATAPMQNDLIYSLYPVKIETITGLIAFNARAAPMKVADAIWQLLQLGHLPSIHTQLTYAKVPSIDRCETPKN